MKRAFVFPGQGSQKIGMGKELAAAFPEARAVFQEVDDALAQHLSALIFDGAEDELKLTENAQPAIMAVSMAVTRVLERQGGLTLGQTALFVAGHSLGEYAALCAAGCFSLSDTARLLRIRGRAMQEAVPQGIGAMAALMGADMEVAARIAAAASTDSEICAAANDNAPGQVVISGHAAAVDRALALAAAQGLRRSLKLPVSAPFHCALMQPAADKMREALAAVDGQDASIPVISNVTAQPVQSLVEIKDLLVRQITGAVRWRESVLFLKEKGIEQVVECGAGGVLAGLVKRIDKDLPCVSLHTPAEIEAFLKGL